MADEIVTEHTNANQEAVSVQLVADGWRGSVKSFSFGEGEQPEVTAAFTMEMPSPDWATFGAVWNALPVVIFPAATRHPFVAVGALIKAAETMLQAPDLSDVPDADKDPETVDAERHLRRAIDALRKAGVTDNG